MKLYFTYILLIASLLLQAQDIVDFEEFEFGDTPYLNGSDGNGGFTSGGLFLPNAFNPAFGSWSGWAISSDTDTLTPGFMNQYSSISGSGFNESDNYAVSFTGGSTSILELTGEVNAIDGFYVNNGTYGYLSMLEGDGFAKKFGGVDGNDPDFFLLTIKKYKDGVLSTDSVDFYLADYRFEDNTQDYIVADWTYVDISNLGIADSLQFRLSSTDNGQFGMNTPAYFCVDQIETRELLIPTKDLYLDVALNVFPNPTSTYLNFNWSQQAGIIRVFDLQGRLQLEQILVSGSNQIDVQTLSQQTYLLQLVTAEGQLSRLFSKVR
ncbi:MAG: DUF4465 domain-containing protein [Bacteroidota bacterium]